MADPPGVIPTDETPATRAVAKRGIVVGSMAGSGVRGNSARPEQQATIRAAITRIRDLLTDDEQESLNRDLAALAQLRRRAEAESRNVVLY